MDCMRTWHAVFWGRIIQIKLMDSTFYNSSTIGWVHRHVYSLRRRRKPSPHCNQYPCLCCSLHAFCIQQHLNSSYHIDNFLKSGSTVNNWTYSLKPFSFALIVALLLCCSLFISKSFLEFRIALLQFWNSCSYNKTQGNNLNFRKKSAK